MLTRLCAAFVLLASFQTSCFPHATCDLIVEVPPVIMVIDGATNTPICDATIVATDALDDASFTLVTSIPPNDAGTSCSYFPASLGPDGSVNGGAGALPDGTYTLQVSRVGFMSVTVSNVVSKSFTCDEQTTPAQQVNVVLTPS